MGAFSPQLRPAIEAIGLRTAAREDLADSFPGLLFAIGTGYGTAAGRQTALAAVDAGCPLREAADRLGLPFWLRKLPAQAFQAPLTLVPAEPTLVNRLLSLVPAQPSATAAWLQRVLIAYHTGRPELALWVAQNYRAAAPSAISVPFLRTLAWAWFAGQTGSRGAELLVSRWTPALGPSRAAGEAALWRERIALDVCLGPGLADSWLASGRGGDYDIVALTTADDFFAEAKAMDNCLDRFADRLMRGTVRVFSMRRAGRPVANVEVSTHHQEIGMPAITQLRAARNRPASPEIWQAAYAWLGGQPLRKAEAGMTAKVSGAERRRRLERVWQPFLDALPADPRHALAASVFPAARASRQRKIPASSPVDTQTEGLESA